MLGKYFKKIFGANSNESGIEIRSIEDLEMTIQELDNVFKREEKMIDEIYEREIKTLTSIIEGEKERIGEYDFLDAYNKSLEISKLERRGKEIMEEIEQRHGIMKKEYFERRNSLIQKYKQQAIKQGLDPDSVETINGVKAEVINLFPKK